MTTDSYRKPPSGIRALVWAVTMFFVFAFLVLVLVRWSSKGRVMDDGRATVRTKALEDRVKDDGEKLGSVGWVDQPGGAVRVPIVDAKRAVIATLKSKQIVPSQVKVDPPLPMPAAAADVAESAPPALPSAPQGSDNMAFAAFAPLIVGNSAQPVLPLPSPATPPTSPPHLEVPLQQPPPPPESPVPPPAPPILPSESAAGLDVNRPPLIDNPEAQETVTK